MEMEPFVKLEQNEDHIFIKEETVYSSLDMYAYSSILGGGDIISPCVGNAHMNISQKGCLGIKEELLLATASADVNQNSRSNVNDCCVLRRGISEAPSESTTLVCADAEPQPLRSSSPRLQLDVTSVLDGITAAPDTISMRRVPPTQIACPCGKLVSSRFAARHVCQAGATFVTRVLAERSSKTILTYVALDWKRVLTCPQCGHDVTCSESSDAKQNSLSSKKVASKVRSNFSRHVRRRHKGRLDELMRRALAERQLTLTTDIGVARRTGLPLDLDVYRRVQHEERERSDRLAAAHTEVGIGTDDYPVELTAAINRDGVVDVVYRPGDAFSATCSTNAVEAKLLRHFEPSLPVPDWRYLLHRRSWIDSVGERLKDEYRRAASMAERRSAALLKYIDFLKSRDGNRGFTDHCDRLALRVKSAMKFGKSHRSRAAFVRNQKKAEQQLLAPHTRLSVVDLVTQFLLGMVRQGGDGLRTRPPTFARTYRQMIYVVLSTMTGQRTGVFSRFFLAEYHNAEWDAESHCYIAVVDSCETSALGAGAAVEISEEVRTIIDFFVQHLRPSLVTEDNSAYLLPALNCHDAQKNDFTRDIPELKPFAGYQNSLKGNINRRFHMELARRLSSTGHLVGTTEAELSNARALGQPTVQCVRDLASRAVAANRALYLSAKSRFDVTVESNTLSPASPTSVFSGRVAGPETSRLSGAARASVPHRCERISVDSRRSRGRIRGETAAAGTSESSLRRSGRIAARPPGNRIGLISDDEDSE